MLMNSKLRGHPIYWDGHQWRYCDDDTPTIQNHSGRLCGHCGMSETPEGHDGCLGTITGVMNACCGHGIDDHAYIQLPDKTVISGEDAVNFINKARGADR